MTNLHFVSLEIKVELDTVLVILLNEDGTINRKGDGTEKKDSPFVMGMGDTKQIFSQINPIIAACEEYFNGSYDDPNKKGKPTTLECSLHSATQSTGFKFIYGADSMGPPKPVGELVIKLLKLTDEWYAKAGKKVTATDTKSWWKFWK